MWLGWGGVRGWGRMCNESHREPVHERRGCGGIIYHQVVLIFSLYDRLVGANQCQVSARARWGSPIFISWPVVCQLTASPVGVISSAYLSALVVRVCHVTSCQQKSSYYGDVVRSGRLHVVVVLTLKFRRKKKPKKKTKPMYL